MENEDIKYDLTATIVYNESDEPWSEEPKPRVISAQDISAMGRSVKKLSQQVTDYKLGKNAVQEYLLENYHELGEHAQEIADLLDIELVKDVTVTVTVEFEVSLSVKPDEDLDDIITNLDYSMENHDSVIEYYTGDVTWQES
jgi:hypothetical protein